MPVFIPKMRQISDVEIDDGTCINPFSVFTQKLRLSYQPQMQFPKAFINESKPLSQKERKKLMIRY